ncbi:MAG: aminopeptidase [Epsilonproteobacteria bacterium]|nr:MAG: aminopeptidase [Campylobacterota bacterium]RLA67892.1 MAG: aminopeptidase [Campylobacterota bacterium]
MFFHLKGMILILFFMAGNAFASMPKKVFISVDADTLSILKKKKFISYVPKTNSKISVVEVNKEDIEKISEVMHNEFRRCGGFMFHENYSDAKKVFDPVSKKVSLFVDYAINRESVVANYLDQVDEKKIIEVIEKLSSFPNRHYQNTNGVTSQLWIKSNWARLASVRSDISVSEFKHRWKQSSIILTIKGSKRSDEIIVFGGHGDSIAGSRYGRRAGNKAPGADDNASGIAVITELIRLVVDNNYVPQRTLKFISYAAEEVGLRGSREVANSLKGQNVIGVIQFDMTNYKGSNNDITLVSDYTSSEQNAFLAKLIDRYVGATWSYGKCGYACSDHASWNSAGFAASFPFEAHIRNANPHIHSSRDTIDKSDYGAKHAVKFAKLGISYLIEMDQ